MTNRSSLERDGPMIFLFYFQSPTPDVEERSIFKRSKDLKIVIVILNKYHLVIYECQ